MTVAYGTIGLFQTFAAYFSFFYCYYDQGFTIRSLIGAGLNYRNDYASLDSERKSFFDNLCDQNTVYRGDCGQEFVDYRVHTLAMAQAAYLLTVVWAQIANVLIRKTQIASILEWKRFTQNTFMLYSILAEIVIIVIIVFVPGLNTVFLLAAPTPKWAACAVWIIPLLIGWDEARKWICRRYPDGFISKYSNF